MTDRIKRLLDETFDKVQMKFRRDVDWQPLLEGFIANGVDDSTRARMGLVELDKPYQDQVIRRVELAV